MKRLICGLSLLGMVVSLLALGCAAAKPGGEAAQTPGAATTGASASKAGWQEKWDRVVIDARKEGEVAYYTTAGAETRIALAQAVKDRFGLRVEFVTGRGPEISARLQKEYGAGVFVADVLNSGGGTFTGLKEMGLLSRMEPALILPEVTDPKAWVMGSPPFIDKDKMFLGMLAVYEQYVARNTELVKEGEISSLRDLVNPRWKGKMVLFDPTATGSGASFVTFVARLWGMDKAREFFLQLSKQDLVVTRDKRLHAEWVAKGKYAIALAQNPEMIAEFVDLGLPVANVKIDEGGDINTAVGGLGMAAKPAHPNAALVFVNWLLSKEGQSVYVTSNKLPGARVDAPREGIDKNIMVKPGDKFILADEDYFILQRDILVMANEIFGPMVR